MAQTGPLCACTERRRVVPCHTYTSPVSLPVKHKSSVGLWQTHSIVAAVPALPNVTGRFSSFESKITEKIVIVKHAKFLPKVLTSAYSEKSEINMHLY